EREGLGHLRGPILEHVLLRQPIEGVVDLDRRVLARVVPEHRVVLQVLGVERALPFLEGKPARTHQNAHDALRSASFSSGSVWARLAFRASMRSMFLPPPSGVTSAVMS